MPNVTVNVTQGHIDKGQKDDCYFCPVAYAVGEAVPRVRSRVWIDKIAFLLPGGTIEVTLPAPAVDFIAGFDGVDPDHANPGPFSFNIDLPTEVTEP